MTEETKKEILKTYHYYSSEKAISLYEITFEELQTLINDNQDYLKELEVRTNVD